MTDRRLLLLHTGGTLGMRPTEWGWEPGADLAGWLSGLMTEQLPDVAWDLVSLEPLIDSSNARPAEWQRIVDAVRQHRGSHQAFVVLHGTDTLAFSAAATHLALAGTGLPVVFTGAQRSFVVDGSDAPGNVLGAIRCALDERLSRVALYFDGVLLAAEHATKTSASDDHGFDSPNLAPLARRTDDGELMFARDPHAAEEPLVADPLPYRPCDLVVLTLHPGLTADRLAAQLTPPPQAVVLRAYGSGNAPDDDPALLAALSRVGEAGTVVVVTTQCPHGAVHLGHYAVSQALLSTGAVSGGGLTTEALVALLTFLLSQGLGPDEVRALLRRAVG